MKGITLQERARELKKHLKKLYDNGKGAEHDNVVDILTDVQHLCLVEGIHFEDALRIAREHAQIEKQKGNILAV